MRQEWVFDKTSVILPNARWFTPLCLFWRLVHLGIYTSLACTKLSKQWPFGIAYFAEYIEGDEELISRVRKTEKKEGTRKDKIRRHIIVFAFRRLFIKKTL